jgi:hypothetical protein
MRRAFLSLFPAALLLASAIGAQAGENCTCRGNNGQDVPEGKTVCMKTASGMKMARCERVLNNTSWKMLEESCPVARSPLSTDAAIAG